jgi:hypothetical protein
LLHGDGTNGAQNNTFIDSSTNNFTITRNGNTTQGTFTPFSKPDGRWGNFFDGNGDSLSVAANSAFDLGGGDFTVEGWFYVLSTTANPHLFQFSTSNINRWAVYRNASANFSLFTYVSGAATDADTGDSVPLNQWFHLAVVKSSTTTKMYLNGSEIYSATTTYPTGNMAVRIGYQEHSGVANDYLTGYVSNLRVVKGTAVYTAAFTPPTAPLTAITNTSLLTCQSNRFIDNSSNNFAITANGDVKVTPFSPFPITTAYSTSVNGGAGYFDGSGDYLSVADNAAFTMGSGDFTVEYWAFLTGTGNQTQIIQINSAGATSSLSFGVQINSSKWRCVLASGSTFYSATSSANAIANQWNHIAFVRNGNTGTLYVNGVADGTVSLTGVSINDSGEAVTIGSEANGNVPTTGWLSSVRVVKGTAVYTAGFTPPTAPLTAITNTSLLTNFTNAGIFDNTGFNALETVGNAQIDTTVKKYGTGSMEFDGTGDYLFMPATPDLTFGSGDFTLEMWVYPSALSGTTSFLYAGRPASTNGAYPVLYLTNSVTAWYVSSSDRITGAALSTGQWSHVAITRSGTSTKLFINGTQSGSTYTDSTNYLLSRVFIGASDFNSGSSEYFNGYIDDLRITKGIARYTTTFTPPTAALPDIGA